MFTPPKGVYDPANPLQKGRRTRPPHSHAKMEVSAAVDVVFRGGKEPLSEKNGWGEVPLGGTKEPLNQSFFLEKKLFLVPGFIINNSRVNYFLMVGFYWNSNASTALSNLPVG